MTEQDTQQDEAYMRSMGERLALLLAAADMPDDVKEAFAAMIPQMNAEQLGKLMKGLEARISSGEDQETARLADAVQKVQEQHEAAVKASEEKALGALNHIEELLKSEEH